MLRLVFLSFLILIAGYETSYAAGYFLDKEGQFSDNFSMFNKWTEVLKKQYSHTEKNQQTCKEPKYLDCDVNRLEELINKLRDEPRRSQIEDVNTYMNAHPYIIDQLNWGKNDYWEIPHEFEEVNGDCEDYAISKYMALRTLDVPEEDMQIVILQDMNLGGILHAVLAVKYDGEYLVLDNQIKQTIPAKKIYHYRPIYSINETGWWKYLQ